MKQMDMRLKFRLPASHSLEEREEVHAHVWRVQVSVTGPLHEGRIASMPLLRTVLEPAIRRLENTVLNENPHLEETLRPFPTCENLALHFERSFTHQLNQANLSLRLTEIEVFVDELSGEETGSARLRLNQP
jgi:6-pyruvoyl-tetrahydropterin synthase